MTKENMPVEVGEQMPRNNDWRLGAESNEVRGHVR